METEDLAQRFATALRDLYARRAAGAIDVETTVILDSALWEAAAKRGFAERLDEILATR